MIPRHSGDDVFRGIGALVALPIARLQLCAARPLSVNGYAAALNCIVRGVWISAVAAGVLSTAVAANELLEAEGGDA